MNRFQLYKKVPSGLIHITSLLADNLDQAIEILLESRSTDYRGNRVAFMEQYNVTGITKPRFNNRISTL
ncbi:hypothetical protein MMC2321_01911 [Chitinophaga sp. MM2321]